MKVFILENNLRERLGHFLNSTLGLARDARRHIMIDDVRVYANRRATREIQQLVGCVPLFRDVTWKRKRFACPAKSLEFMARRYAADCAQIEGISQQDVLIVPSAQQNQVRGIELYLASLPRRSRPRVVLNFHVENMSGIAQLVNPLMRSFERLHDLCGNKISITSPTPGLAAKLKKLCGEISSHTYPLPQNYEISGAKCNDDIGSEPQFAVLGRPLKRKGTSVVAALISGFEKSANQCRFVVQCSLRSKGLFAQLMSKNVALRFGGLTPEEYASVLHESDIVLMPYDPDAYKIRTSGIFADCAAFGKVAVVPDHSWMAEQIRSGHAAGTIYDNCAENGLAIAAAAALDELPKLRQQASEASKYWWKEQSSAAYINRLMADFYPVSEIETFRLVNMAAENDPQYSPGTREFDYGSNLVPVDH